MISLPLDILADIACFLDKGSDIKSFIMIAPDIAKIAKVGRVIKHIDNHTNHLETLYHYKPNRFTNFAKLSENPHLTMKIVNSIGTDKDWDYAIIADTSNDRELVEYAISKCPTKTISLGRFYKLYYKHITEITTEFVEMFVREVCERTKTAYTFGSVCETLAKYSGAASFSNPVLSGYLWQIAFNKRTKASDIIANYEKVAHMSLSIDAIISKKSDVTFEMISANPHIKWNYYHICIYSHMHITRLLEHPQTNVCSIALSSRRDVTLSVIRAYPNYPWVWAKIAENGDINVRQFIGITTSEWSVIDYARNPNLSWRDIIGRNDIMWNWPILLRHI